VLLVTLHHIIADGWSVRVLLGELLALYDAARRGGTAKLAALPIRYADYAAWQRNLLDAGALKPQLDYWRQRLAFMASDAELSALLTSYDLAGGLGNDALPVVLIDDDSGAPWSETAPAIEVSPQQPAYVIYTSGSTGRPKGVVVSHENAARLFTATDGWFSFAADDVWTLFHSYAFDFSVWETFGALGYGGRLVIVPQLVSRSPEEFLDLLIRERVTVLNQTPSAFRQLMSAALARPEKPDLAQRMVVFGGEALEIGALGPWFTRFGETAPRLINMYGITETTVHVIPSVINSDSCHSLRPKASM
jgi:non-ribosomal peptide synthetase component F